MSVGHIYESCKYGWADQDAHRRLDSGRPEEPWCFRWGSRYPNWKGLFSGLSGPLKSIGSLCYGTLCSKISITVTPGLWQLHAMLHTGRCHVTFSRPSIVRTLAMWTLTILCAMSLCSFTESSAVFLHSPAFIVIFSLTFGLIVWTIHWLSPDFVVGTLIQLKFT